ncbi:MAG: hypothetical protein Q4D92_02285, partial [Slackia sp.]|nr:hypothetical protein [Slackia sp.]
MANAPKEDIGTPADVKLEVSSTTPTTGDGEGKMYIVRKGQESPTTVTLPVSLHIKESESIGNFQHPVTLTVNVPYLYIDEQGAIQETLSEKEWIGKDPGNLRMRLAVMPVPDKKWAMYRRDDTTGNFVLIDDKSDDLTKGLSGTIQFRYIGNGGHMQGTEYGTPQFKVEFQGPVPEAATATVGVGMHVGVKTDANGEHYGDFTIDPGTNSAGSIRKATFVNTNLEWTSSITPISQNSLWDRVNYMVYELHMKNVSKTTEASIHHAAFSISTKVEQSNAIRQEDIAAFKRLPDGSVVKNDNPDDTSVVLTGVPGEGGVLIYDVTNLSEEQRAAIDLDRFSNVGDFGLKEIDYQSLQAGQVNINLAHDAPVANGHLVSKGEEGKPDYKPDNYDETVLYVAMPFTTNFQPIEDGVGKRYPPINMESIPTVYFGVNGANSWSKTKETVTRAFEYPKIEFLQTKNALAADGTPQAEANGVLGYVSHYTITDIKSQGNMPLFGMESESNGWGPVMVDALPDGFDLSSLDIVLEKQDTPGLPENDVKDWFCTEAEGSYVQFETEGSGGAKSWVSLGTPVYQGETPDGKLMWKLGGDNEGEMLNDRLAELPETFTGSVRFIFRDALAAGRIMPGFIRVNGVMVDPHNAYQNNVTSTYAQKQWNPPTIESEGYYTYNERTSTAQATLLPEDAAPTLQSYAYTARNDGSTDQGPSVIAPLGSESSGYRFMLGNNSSSKIAPARLAITGFDFTSPSAGGNFGFVATKISLSKDLLAQASGISVVLHTLDGSDITITSDQLAGIASDDSGSIAIKRDAWFENEYLTGLDVLIDSFEPSSKHPDAQAFVDVFGAPTRVDSFVAHGVFSTDYDEEFADEQRSAESDAELVVERPSATVHAHASYVDVSEVTKSNTLSTDGDQAQISVPYDRDFALWADIGNESESMLDDVDVSFDIPLSMEKGIVGSNGSSIDAWTGFHVTDMVLSARFLASFPTKGEVRFYDAAGPDAPSLVLVPTPDGVGLEGGGTIYLPDGEGNIRIPEKALSAAGVENVSKVVLHSWKGMPSGTSADGTTVLFEGFADAPFDTTRTMGVEAVNHFGGVRPQGDIAPSMPFDLAAAETDEDPWSASTVDSALFYMSKMSFDVSARAGFVEEGDAARFSQLAATGEHNHRADGDVDKTLELGYKAMGSYMVDFRQFTNAWNERPDATSDKWDTQDKGNNTNTPYAKLLSAKTYNTAAQLTLTQNLPKDHFDAYYIKVHPDKVDNLKSIEVFYSDGSSWKSDAASWGDTANAVETDENGIAFFRVNLLKRNDAGVSGEGSFEPDFSDDKKLYHRDAVDDYAQDDFTGGVYNVPVAERIVYTLDINENQYADDEHTKAAGPDFGTEYQAADATNAAIEVTGRFYKEDNRAESAAKQTVQASLSIGGEQGDGRHERAAVNRFTSAKQGSANEYSSWSYRDYAYLDFAHRDHIEGHISSHADVDVIFDGNFVLKGTKGKLEYGADGDDHAVMGGDYRFDVSFARDHVTLGHGYGYPSAYYYDSVDDRAPDNWAGNVSFADKVVLTDNLPVCGPEKTHGYYGFLATGMELLAGDAGVLDHLERIVFEIETAQSNQTALTESAVLDVAPAPLTAARREVVFTKDQIADCTDAAGNVFIGFDAFGEKPAPETVAPGVNAKRIALAENEFVKSYRIDLAEYTGDGDYAAETGETYKGQRSGTIDDRDLYVFGRPYVYKGQTSSDKNDAMNTVTAHGYRSAHPDAAVASVAVHTNGYRYTPSDQAYYLGYLIPFSAGYQITGTDGSTANRSVFDYRDDNNTPTVVDHEVYFWNKKDENDGDRRSARITRATLKTEEYYNANYEWFRMQHVYIPQEFVDVKGNAAYENWFKVDSVTFAAGGKQLKYQLQDLADKGLLKPGDNGEYVLDVEDVLRLDPSVLETYSMTSKTNTLNDLRNTTEDAEYTKAYVDNLTLDFKAAHPSYDDDDTTLDGGQYLAADKKNKGYAFRYDGVFVDRTTPDFSTDASWDETSTPTFGKNANGYGKEEGTGQYLTASNIETIDPNHDRYRDDKDVVRSNYVYVSNLRAQMDVTYDRGKTVELNGTEQEVFAYDLGVMNDPIVADGKGDVFPGESVLEEGVLEDVGDTPADSGSVSDEAGHANVAATAGALDQTITLDGEAGSGSSDGEGSVSGNDEVTEMAVDPESNSMSDPSSIVPYAGKGNDIANGTLFAGDYVEYTLGIAAAESYGGKRLPLQKVDARFAVPDVQRIVGWEIVENTTGSPDEQITARLVEEDDADGDGVPNSSIECDPARNYSRIDAQTGEPLVDGVESYGYNRNLVLSVGSAGAEFPYGASLKIRVITQMTDKAAGHDGAAYDASGNAAWNGEFDNPAYAGKAYQARFVATAEPLHGYAQYDVAGSGSDTVYATRDDGGAIRGNSATSVSYSRGNGAIVDPSKKQGRFGALTYASNVFYKHEYDRGQGVVKIEGAFTEPSLTDPDNYMQDNDGSPAQLTVSNITNETSHAGNITVTTSFMKTVEDKTTGQGVEYRSFELTEAPKIAASSTEVLQEGGVDVGVRYPVDMPVNRERLPILVEYFDESLPDGGAWVSEADLAARYGAVSEGAEGQTEVEPDVVPDDSDVSDAGAGVAAVKADASASGDDDASGAASEDGMVEDSKEDLGVSDSDVSGIEPAADEQINIFKNVTQVRWTYFDVPATSDGVKPYAFENVALIGVGRFSDVRPSTGEVEQDDCFGGVKVDWGFIHYHHEKNIIDFITAPNVLETPDFEAGLDGGMPVDPDMGFDFDMGVDEGIMVASSGGTASSMRAGNDAASGFGEVLDGDMMIDPGEGVDPGMGFDPDAGVDGGMMVDPDAQPEEAVEDARVEHGVTLTKASEYAEAPLNVWRRVPVMQFQTQTFQTEQQAQNPYDPDASQKLAYIPGETFY